jgi:hypothetical protein
MKTFRAYLTGCLLLVSATGLSGCATTRSGDAAAHEPAAANAWDGLTVPQQIAQSLWWTFQLGLMVGGTAFGGK